jgi:hypothetical protein
MLHCPGRICRTTSRRTTPVTATGSPCAARRAQVTASVRAEATAASARTPATAANAVHAASTATGTAPRPHRATRASPAVPATSGRAPHAGPAYPHTSAAAASVAAASAAGAVAQHSAHASSGRSRSIAVGGAARSRRRFDTGRRLWGSGTRACSSERRGTARGSQAPDRDLDRVYLGFNRRWRTSRPRAPGDRRTRDP